MSDLLSDRAEAILSAGQRLALSLTALARALGVSPEALAAQLQGDDRFIIIHPPTAPDFTLLTAADREAYTAALRAAGWADAPRVALAAPPHGARSVDGLLRESLSRLLARTPEPALLAVAERLEEAVRAATGPGRAAPSTTPPPDPCGRDGAPPRRRCPPRRPPPYPGSRRG